MYEKTSKIKLNFFVEFHMTSTMVFAISTPSSSSTGVKTSFHCYLPNSAISVPRNSISQQIKCIPHLGFAPLPQWNGLEQMGISISQYPVKIEKKGKCKGKGVYASLFGVGAPEILVIGVVSLLVFGPKGLAEVARNLGKTLRAFQPTIRELQEVSREFKSTLEREIGLDDIDNPVPRSPISNPTKPKSEDKPVDLGANIEPNGSSSKNGEDPIDESIKARADLFRGALAQLQKEQQEEKEKAEIEAQSQTPSPDTPQEDSSVTRPSENPDNNALQEAASVVKPTTGPTPKTEIKT
ncbi:hypothetical protein CASFOL_023610 [Castilleja foliolosa]|uniref:Sec-independent protein translocase protein TatA n=1 Tax=Castilleja foliolosa TaxID=1961234 RepID=A0ABD3CNX6_9LAMI